MLAANKVNQAKATKAASNRRRLGGPSEAEKEAWGRNMLIARQVLHDDRTWKYATCFRHGLHAVSLERSLVLAGESAEEYQAHLARFDRLVRGLEPGPLSDPARLARGTALAAWRRLRALRLDHEWTLRALVAALQQAIGRREQGSNYTPSLASSNPVTGSFAAASPDAAVKAAGGFLDVASLTRLGCDLEAASGSWVRTWPAITRLNNRFDQLWCALVEELGAAPPFLPSSFCWERACMRPSPIVAAYLKWPAEVLGNPLVRPSRVVALLVGREVRVRPVSEWGFHPVFRSLLEAEAHDLHEEVERQAAELDRLECRRLVVAGDPDYRLLSQARRAEEAGGRFERGTRAEDVCHSEPVRSSAANGPECSEGAQGKLREESRSVPGEFPAPPQTFEEFWELVERAFGPEPPPDARGGGEGSTATVSSGAASSPAIPGTGSVRPVVAGSSDLAPSPDHFSPSSVEEVPGVVSFPLAESQEPNEPADDRGRLRRVAELLWQRVARVRERADQEARELAQLLDAYGDQLGRPKTNVEVPEAPAASADREATNVDFAVSPVRVPPSSVGPAVVGLRPPKPREEIAVRVLKLFRELKAHHVRSGARERMTRLALYDLAAGRFGKKPEFDDLKMRSDRFDQLYHEFFEVFFSQFQPRPDAGSGWGNW